MTPLDLFWYVLAFFGGLTAVTVLGTLLLTAAAVALDRWS